MPTLKRPSRTKRCDFPPGDTQMMGPSDYKEIFHMKKVGDSVDLRATTRKSIRSVCNAKTKADRDAPAKKKPGPLRPKSTSKGSKRSSVKASKRGSHSQARRKSKSRRKKAASASASKAAPPTETPVSTGIASTKRGNTTTPPPKPEELEMEPEVVVRLPPKPKPPDTGLDITGFIWWIFSCCGLCSKDDDDASAEAADAETYYSAAAAPPPPPPKRSQKMQGSPVASSQAKSKNVSTSKQQ